MDILKYIDAVEVATPVKSQNIAKLPQEARDIIQAVFDDNLPVCFGLPADAIEVKLDNPVANLLYGEGTIHFHALGNTEHYLHYRCDNEWAIVSRGENIGNADRGRYSIKTGGGEQWQKINQ